MIDVVINVCHFVERFKFVKILRKLDFRRFFFSDRNFVSYMNKHKRHTISAIVENVSLTSIKP